MIAALPIWATQDLPPERHEGWWTVVDIICLDNKYFELIF